jgi:hypothetical protein
VVRAGGERGFGALYGAQRPKRTSAANLGRTICSLSVPSQIFRRHQISVGHGNANRNRAARRGTRRLCISRHPNPAGG